MTICDELAYPDPLPEAEEAVLAGTAVAMAAVADDHVAAASARATAAASWVGYAPRRALALAQRATDELAALPAGVGRDAALYRAGSAAAAALLALDAPDAAQRWLQDLPSVPDLDPLDRVLGSAALGHALARTDSGTW